MAKLTLLFGAIFISYAQCAVLNTEDSALKRTVRSPCYTCGGKPDFPPLPPPIIPPPPPPVIPPPPPPVLRAENWSGLARSSDGLQNAVFSGAAAAAKQGAQASGEAFSLASSTVNGVGAGLSNGQAGYGEAASLGGSIGVKHEISSGISGDGHISKGGHGYGDYSGGNFKEARSYHSVNGKYYGNDESQLSNSNGPSFGSASLLDQNAKIAGEAEYQGYGSGISAESSRNGHFDKYHNGDAQQVQAEGFGAGSGTQNGYLSQNEDNSGGVEYKDYNHGVSGGHSHEQHGGRYLADAQRDQQVYDSSSSSQSGTFGRNIGGSGHGENGGHYENQRGSFGDQQSSKELQYGSAHSGGDSITQLHSNGYGSSPSSQSGAFGQNIGGSGYGGYGSHYKSGRSSFGPRESSQEELQNGSAHSGGDSIAQLHSSGYGSSSQGEIEKAGHTELQSTGQAQFVQGDSGLQAGGSGSLTGDAQSALSGALNLASQGVQASQQGSTGCSTCGKSSYALSNAKSYSGSAVAVSIGG